MTTLRLTAALCAAFLLTTAASAASAASVIHYDLTGRVSRTYDVLSDPNADPVAFDDVRFDLDLTGDLPGTELANADLVHLDSGELTIGHHTADFTFGPHAVFGIRPDDGVAAFGRLNATGFHPAIVFGSPALVGYDGQQGFDRHHVWVDVRHPFDVMFGDKLVRLDITDFDRGRFSASPEPMAWALMLVGFAGAGAQLRRRRLGFA